MVPILCCLGPFFKQQGKYYPRRNEEKVIEQFERSTWRSSKLHEEAEYPYEWLMSASTTKRRNGRDPRRRFLSRIRSVHAVTDAEPEVGKEFVFNSIVADDNLSRKESKVLKSLVDSEVQGGSDLSQGHDEHVQSQSVEDGDVGRPKSETDIGPSGHTNLASSGEAETTCTSTLKENENTPIAGQELLSNSKEKRLDVNKATVMDEKSVEIEQRSEETTALSSAARSNQSTAESSRDQNSSSDHQAHQQSDQDGEDIVNEGEQTPLVSQDHVMDHARLDVDRQEQRNRDWIINRPATTPRGPSVTGQAGRSSHRHPQRESNRTARPRSDQIIYPPTTGLTGRRPNPLCPELPLMLLQPSAQQSHPEHRVRQLSDMEHIHRTLSQYHMQRISRSDEAEQGDQRHQQQRRPQHPQRPHPAGEVRTLRNDIERTRDNIVRELRQQAHRIDNREGYVSRVMALVRERHSLSDQHDNNHGPGSRPGHSPEQEGQMGPPNMEQVQRLNPRPPRRRRRCQKHYNGAIYQPKKE